LDRGEKIGLEVKKKSTSFYLVPKVVEKEEKKTFLCQTKEGNDSMC